MRRGSRKNLTFTAAGPYKKGPHNFRIAYHGRRRIDVRSVKASKEKDVISCLLVEG